MSEQLWIEHTGALLREETAVAELGFPKEGCL